MIYLAPHDPHWAQLYQEEKQRLSHALGYLIIAIEHIGSTAIPNIVAKPVIDIMLGVRSLHDIDQHVIQSIEQLDYRYMPQYEIGMPFRRFFQKDNMNGTRTHHIHLVEISHSFWTDHLLFRDYLRTHPDSAKAYEQLKQKLAQQFTDTNAYAFAKTDFCKEILRKAKQ